jgi:hypothetical protein
MQDSRKAMRRHKDEAVESEKEDITPVLLLKHQDTTLVTYV